MVKRMMDLIEEAREEIQEIPVTRLLEMLKTKSNIVLLDVREHDELEKFGTIKGSVSIPRGFLEQKVEKNITDAETQIVVFCAAGHRSLLAAKTLLSMGYKNVSSLSGGYNDWLDSSQDNP